MIDLAEEFYCPRQSEKYNESYRNWRKNKKNPYAFQFICNPREHAYVEGIGFVEETPSRNERMALEKFSFLLGGVMALCFAVEIFGEGILCAIARCFGSEASWSILGGISGGSEQFSVFCRIVIGILQQLFPAIVFLGVLKFPVRAAFPIITSDKTVSTAAPAIAMILTVICNFLNLLYLRVLNLVGITEQNLPYYFPESLPLRLIMAAFDVLLLSVIMEICVHGIILQPLRQFGDDFALLASSLLAALLSHDIVQCCQIFIISLGIGYFVLNSGSLFTGIIMRIIVNAANYVLSLLNFSFPAQFRTAASAWLLMFLLIAGICLILFGSKSQRSKLGFTSYRITSASYLPIKNKFTTLFTSPTMILWLVMIFILTVANLL